MLRSDRPWRPEVAVLPRVTIDGDRVHITGARNFKYRSQNDFDVRYEKREILLSHLRTLDLFVSYWHDGPVAHTFVSFDFDNAPPVSTARLPASQEHDAAEDSNDSQ